MRAALERLHPEQCDFVFSGGLTASTGAAAVLGVKTLLERLSALESGEERKDTRKADLAALKTLEKRKIATKEERKRLGDLVKTAQTLSEPAVLPDIAPNSDRQKALIELYAWFKDWTETARSVVKKRSHLITLGLAKRRSSDKSATSSDSPAPAKNTKTPTPKNGKPAEPVTPA